MQKSDKKIVSLFEKTNPGFQKITLTDSLRLKRGGYLKNPGHISGLFLIFYSIFRFIIEFFRIPDEQLGYLVLNLTMGQIMSFMFFLFGTYLLFRKYEIKKTL